LYLLLFTLVLPGQVGVVEEQPVEDLLANQSFARIEPESICSWLLFLV
jgi:hypothetical protein